MSSKFNHPDQLMSLDSVSAKSIVGEDGAGFELTAPRRVIISASGTCSSSKWAYFELLLLNAAEPGRAQLLSIVQMDNKTAEFGGMGVAASLVLPAGRFTWKARAVVRENGSLKLTSNIRGEHLILEPHSIDTIGSVSCTGSSGGFLTVQSSNPKKALQASAIIRARLGAGDELRGFLSYSDDQQNGMESPETLCVGPAGGMKIDAYIVYLDNSARHTFGFTGFQTGSFESNSSVSVGG